MNPHADHEELDTDVEHTVDDGETHATTGGAAAAGAVTGGVIGLTGGPVGVAIGAVGGAIVGAAAERLMHSDDDAERARAGLGRDHDHNVLIEDHAAMPATSASYTNEYTTPTVDERVEHTDVTLDHPLVEPTPIERRPSDMPGPMTSERTSNPSVRAEDVRVEQRPG